jgi:hypothetical protein
MQVVIVVLEAAEAGTRDWTWTAMGRLDVTAPSWPTTCVEQDDDSATLKEHAEVEA